MIVSKQTKVWTTLTTVTCRVSQPAASSTCWNVTTRVLCNAAGSLRNSCIFSAQLVLGCRRVSAVFTEYCPQKRSHLMFDNNFGKCWLIFTSLSPTDSWGNSVCMHTTTFTWPAICCYITLWMSKIQKCYWFWQHPQQTVDMFLKTLWTLNLTFNSSYTDCLKTADSEDWLTFWSLSDDVSNRQLHVIQLNIVASWRYFHDDRLHSFILSMLYFMCCTHIEVQSIVQYFVAGNIITHSKF